MIYRPESDWFMRMPRQHQWHTDQWYHQHKIPMNQGTDQTWDSEAKELTSYGEITKTLTPPLWVTKMKGK